MIKLSVQPYCHNCNRFSPEVLQYTAYCDGRKVITEQEVVCEYRFECEKIEEYIRNELIKSTENKGD